MNPNALEWKRKLVLTRHAPPGTKKGKRNIMALPALISDLSVHDWWQLILHVMRNEFSSEGFIMLSGSRYQYELREEQPDDKRMLPAQPLWPKAKVKVRWRTKKKKRNANPPTFIVRDDIPTTPLPSE